MGAQTLALTVHIGGRPRPVRKRFSAICACRNYTYADTEEGLWRSAPARTKCGVSRRVGATDAHRWTRIECDRRQEAAAEALRPAGPQQVRTVGAGPRACPSCGQCSTWDRAGTGPPLRPGPARGFPWADCPPHSVPATGPVSETQASGSPCSGRPPSFPLNSRQSVTEARPEPAGDSVGDAARSRASRRNRAWTGPPGGGKRRRAGRPRGAEFSPEPAVV